MKHLSPATLDAYTEGSLDPAERLFIDTRLGLQHTRLEVDPGRVNRSLGINPGKQVQGCLQHRRTDPVGPGATEPGPHHVLLEDQGG